jgi:hypothetical protein
LAAAFDGITSQKFSACSVRTQNNGNYVGRHYGGGAQAIGSVTIYPSSDFGFSPAGPNTSTNPVTVTINLRAKATLPANSADGTLLGTTGPVPSTVNALSITSSDQVTTWNYVWVEVIITQSGTAVGAGVAELQQFSPAGTGTGSAVNVEILGPPLLYTVPVVTWRLGTYSLTTGWPTCGCYQEGRIWLGGAIANRWDASVSNGLVGDTLNFAPTDQYGTVGGANAISYVLDSDGVNPIQWMVPDQQGVIMGTQAAEWLTAPLVQGAMAPNNVASRRIMRIGGAPIVPVRAEHTLVFVQRYSRKLMECFADVYSGKFTAPNLAERAQHIPRTGVAELAYQQAVTPILWGRNNDGSFFGITYKRDTLATSHGPTYAGWHRHALGSGNSVTSIAGGPSDGGSLDSLSMVTLDPTTGFYNVEVMTDVLDELSTVTQAWYCDNACVPSSTSPLAVSGSAPYGGLVLNGLTYLNGRTVTAFLGGLDCGDYLVSGGSISVPYGDGVSAGTGGGFFTAAFVAAFQGTMPMVVGFTITSQGQLLRVLKPEESGTRAGPSLGNKRRTHELSALLVNTYGVSFDVVFPTTYPAKLLQADDFTPIVVGTTYSGVYWDSMAGDYSYDSMPCWQITRPYPCNISMISGKLTSQVTYHGCWSLRKYGSRFFRSTNRIAGPWWLLWGCELLRLCRGGQRYLWHRAC